jgi:hypothetical protein
MLDLSQGRFNEIVSLSANVSVIETERMSQILSKAISQLGWSSLPRFVLEMASVRMTKLEALARFEQGGDRAFAPVVSELKPVEMKKESIPTLISLPTDPEQKPEGGATWKQFVEFVMKKRPILGALLSHAHFKLETVENGKNAVVAFSEGSFYEKQVKDSKNTQDINEFLKSFFGLNSELKFSKPESTFAKSLEEEKQMERASVLKEALAHPAIQQAKEIFGSDSFEVRVELP